MIKFIPTMQKLCFSMTAVIGILGCKGNTGAPGTPGTPGTTLPSFSSAFPNFPTTAATACSEQTNTIVPFLSPYTDCPSTLFHCTWTCYTDASCTTAGSCALLPDTEDIVLPPTCDLSAAISVGFGFLAACAAAGDASTCPNFGLSCQL